MHPTTATQPVNTTSCAGDKIELLRSFKDGKLTVVVPDGKTAVITAINFGGSVATSVSQHYDKCGVVFFGAPYSETCNFQLSETLNPQPIHLAGSYELTLTPPSEDALVDVKFIDKDCCTIQLKCPAVIVAPPPPPVTQTISPCPVVFPMVWDYDGATYPTLGAFVTAYKAAMMPAVVTFDAPCTLSGANGTVFLPSVLSAVPVVPPPPPSKTCGVTDATGQYPFTIPEGSIANITMVAPPDTLVSDTVNVGATSIDYSQNGCCWCMSNVDSAPNAMLSNTIIAAGTHTLTTFPVRAGIPVCVELVKMTPSEIAALCPQC
jgi:hypothetical protein